MATPNCTAVTTKVAQCTSYTADNTCSGCASGYRLVNATTCGALNVTNCASGNETHCSTCKTGYDETPDQKQCVKETDACSAFDNAKACVACKWTASYFATDIGAAANYTGSSTTTPKYIQKCTQYSSIFGAIIATLMMI